MKVKNDKKMGIRKVLLAVLMVISTTQAQAGEQLWESTISHQYDIFSDGKDIGDIRVTRSRKEKDEEKLYRTEDATNVKVAGTWGSWEMSATGETITDEQGLFRFDQKIVENGKRWRITGSRQEEELWCSARQVQTKKEKENDDLIGISKMVLAETVPYAGQAMTVLGLLSEEGEGDFQIPLDSFDVTPQQLPGFLTETAKGLKDKQIRILDITELEIIEFIFTEIASETIQTGDKSFKCRVFTATSSSGNFTYWLAEDVLGGFFVKQKGKDKNGPYEIVLER